MVIFWNYLFSGSYLFLLFFFLLTIPDPPGGYRNLERPFTDSVGGVSAVTHLLFRAASV